MVSLVLDAHFPPVNTSLSCVVAKDELVRCINMSIDLTPIEKPLTPNERLFWVYLLGYLVLVMIAGLMSGLTLAILSLDATGLKVLMMAGTARHKKYASRILPFAKRHHIVLIVLVMANSLAVEAMPIFLDRISDPILAVTVSTTAVVIFGEVLPQAICSRFGLAIGYYFSWLVWGLIGLFFVIAWPVSKLLDFLLGKGHGTFYRRAELQALVDIHGPPIKPEDIAKGEAVPVVVSRATSRKDDECLTLDEVLIMKGAINLAAKEARHAMTQLSDVFMLSSDRLLDRATLKEIFDSGRSRIPIFDGDNRMKILGVLLAKKLILVDPCEAKPLRQVIKENWNNCIRKPFLIPENKPLYELLHDFQPGVNTHIAFVKKKNPESKEEEIKGIVTMEQVLEQLLQEQIYDEADYARKASSRVHLARAAAERQLSQARGSQEEQNVLLKPLLTPTP